MAWRRIRPRCSHNRYGHQHFLPPEGWPTRRVWVNRFEDDHERLKDHPVWKVARIAHLLKGWAENPGNAFVAFDMADECRGTPFGLVYCFGPPYEGSQDHVIIARDPERTMGIGQRVIALTREHCSGENRSYHALSWIVDVLARRDPDTMEPWPAKSDDDPAGIDDVYANVGVLNQNPRDVCCPLGTGSSPDNGP